MTPQEKTELRAIVIRLRASASTMGEMTLKNRRMLASNAKIYTSDWLRGHDSGCACVGRATAGWFAKAARDLNRLINK